MEKEFDIEKYSISELEEIVKEIVRSDYTENNIDKLCQIYYRAVIAGSVADSLSKTCNSAVQLIRLGREHLVYAELHHLLCCIPDMYYDFVWGVENNIKNNYNMQDRLLKFMKEYRGADSFTVNVYVSILNQVTNDAIPDEEIYKTVHYCAKPGIEEIDWGNVARKLNIFEYTGHDWQMCKTFVQGKPYTVRLNKCVCFVDFLNRAVASGCIVPHMEDIGLLIYIVVRDGDGKCKDFPGVQDYILTILETMARYKRWTKIVITDKTKGWDFFKARGYREESGDEYDFPGEQMLVKNL